MRLCYFDTEGYATPDITDVGSYQWTHHPSHGIHCAAFVVDDEPTPTILPYELFNTDLPDYLIDSEAGSKLDDLAKDPNVTFVMHNAAHDLNEWAFMVMCYGLIELPLSRVKCTMAKCYAHGLPGRLEKALIALNSPLSKDMVGNKLMLKFAKPKKDGSFWKPEDDPEGFVRMYSYCADDVLATRWLDQNLRDLSPYEQRVWQIDQRINQTGVCIDTEYVEKAIALSEQYHADLSDAFYKATLIESPTLRKPFQRWLKDNGCELQNTQAPTIKRALADGTINSRVKNALELFATAGKTSLAKYPAFQTKSVLGTLREIYQYHGAHTGRWAGRGVQIHNLKRPAVPVRQLVEAILNHDYETFEWMYGDSGEALSSGLRSVIVARPGRKLYVGDYGQIESRVLAWLAGEETKLSLFRAGVDVYSELAKTIGCDRQGGKVGDLSLGFGGGINAYAKMGRGYNIDFASIAKQIWATASHSERKRAEYCYELYLDREPEEPVTREVGLAINVIKDRFREAHPRTVQYWADLEAAAIEAIESGKETRVRNVAYFMHGVFLWCRLPSGRVLAYPFPKVERDKKGRAHWTYKTEYNGQWIRKSTWGGTQAENIVQAVARDVMVSAMVDMEIPYPWLFHTHDEGVVETFGHDDSFDVFMQMLANPPCLETWAKGLPLTAAGYETTRYGVK